MIPALVISVVDPPEALDGGADERLAAGLGGHVARVGDRHAAGGLDLGDDLGRRPRIGARRRPSRRRGR